LHFLFSIESDDPRLPEIIDIHLTAFQLQETLENVISRYDIKYAFTGSFDYSLRRALDF